MRISKLLVATFASLTTLAMFVTPAIVLATALLTTQPAHAQTNLKVLYTFQGAPDAAAPNSGLVRDALGNLYGTSYSGGAGAACLSACGTLYKLDTSGKETVLHSFTSDADGANPIAGLFLDSAGNFYGTTRNGGSFTSGTVFKLDSSGQESVLYSFAAAEGQPGGGTVTQDKNGNLFGTTYSGGSKGYGAVFQLDQAGTEMALYNFTGGKSGANSYAGLVGDSAGNFYGTTTYGGVNTPCGAVGCGTVFKLDTTGHQTLLYSFAGGKDGRNPYAGLVRDSAGNLYGTTLSGGAGASCCGTVFKVDSTGKHTVIYAFAGGMDGASPLAGLMRFYDGNLYGTTLAGGAFGLGTVFKIDSTGKETVMHAFTGGADGAVPSGSLVPDFAGNLYGTTSQGGATGNGTVFVLTF